jgi:phosphatidate cytidylyltransferase
MIALFGVFIAAGAWEWSGLCLRRTPARIGYVAIVVALGVAATSAVIASHPLAIMTFVFACAWWLLVLVVLAGSVDGIFQTQEGRALAGILVLVPAWAALGFLHEADANRPLLVLFVLVLVGIADTAAYAAGRVFGRTKLAPAISPGKTVEGVIGAIVAVALLAAAAGAAIWHLRGARLGVWTALAVVTALISVLGDLAESKMKRIAGVKDSGRLLPGHGGVLDRIDALTAAAPVFALGWLAAFDARA